MEAIERLNGVLDLLIEDYNGVKQEAERLKSELENEKSLIFTKDQEINDLKTQLWNKSQELENLINKISSALGQ